MTKDPLIYLYISLAYPKNLRILIQLFSNIKFPNTSKKIFLHTQKIIISYHISSIHSLSPNP